MGAKRVVNRIVRMALLILVSVLLLIYLAGIVANVFGLLEMRRPDDQILSSITTITGASAAASTIPYADGFIASIHVQKTEKDSVAVFFVHGSPGSLDAYTVYLRNSRLQEKSSLYSYDRLGYGGSRPKEAGRSLFEQSEQLHALVQSVGARRNVFVGHSLGCSIIAKYAMDHGSLCDGLIMVAAPIDPSLEPSAWWRPILNFPMISIALPHAFRISNHELYSLKEDLREMLPQWPKISCPVTFIHGDKDTLVPLGNVAFGKSKLINAQVKEKVIVGKGHFILWTHVDVIVEEILTILP